MGFERREYFPGRAFAGAIVLSEACTGMGALPHPGQESLYVRLGHASGRRNYGRAGKAGRAGGAEGRGLICTRCSEQCPTHAKSSSSAEATTVSSPPSIWPKRD